MTLRRQHSVDGVEEQTSSVIVQIHHPVHNRIVASLSSVGTLPAEDVGLPETAKAAEASATPGADVIARVALPTDRALAECRSHKTTRRTRG